MKLILVDGGPASGKNTLGTLLVDKFQQYGEKTILIDLDNFVEKLNPKWIWESKQQEQEDQLNARISFAKDISRYLKGNFTVIAIGERFLTKEDVTQLVSKLDVIPQIYIYHLNTPLALRKQRLHKRGPHTLIDLEKDQKERDVIKNWPGYIYKNINPPQKDAENLYKLIQENKGLIQLN